MSVKKIAVMGIALGLLNGCMEFPNPDDPRYAPILPDIAQLPKPQHGSLYMANSGLKLFSDMKSHRVGDIITVTLVERTQASKDAATNTKKEYDATLQNPTFLGTGAKLNIPKDLPTVAHKDLNLELSVDSSQEFKGSGNSSQNNSLSGDITVSIAQVLPNDNLVIRGEKWITLNQGSEFIRLTGVVRPQDVGPDNTVVSTRIANARITYAGKGALADANAMGFLARFFNTPLWPF